MSRQSLLGLPYSTGGLSVLLRAHLFLQISFIQLRTFSYLIGLHLALSSSRRNDFLILVGIDLAVSLLAKFSLMPCFRIKAHLHHGFHRKGSTLCNGTCVHTVHFSL
jgi:hypothetical protein